MMQLAHPKVAQLKLGAFRPQVCHCWTMLRPTRILDSLAKKPAVWQSQQQINAVGFVPGAQLSLPPTRQYSTQGQWPEGQIIVGIKEGGGLI